MKMSSTAPNATEVTSLRLKSGAALPAFSYSPSPALSASARTAPTPRRRCAATNHADTKNLSEHELNTLKVNARLFY